MMSFCSMHNAQDLNCSAYDLLYESLFVNDQIELCQLLWVSSLGVYPQPRESSHVVSVGPYNAQAERQGLPVRFRPGEDPSYSGDVIDTRIT